MAEARVNIDVSNWASMLCWLFLSDIIETVVIALDYILIRLLLSTPNLKFCLHKGSKRLGLKLNSTTSA